MMNYIATLTIIPVPTVRHLLMSEHPLRLSKLLHRSPINYFCISESSLCLACNNNEDLNFVSWKDSPIWPCVENALSNHTARVLTNNNQPPLLTICVLTEQALDRSPQQHGQESFLKAWLLFTWFGPTSSITQCRSNNQPWGFLRHHSLKGSASLGEWKWIAFILMRQEFVLTGIDAYSRSDFALPISDAYLVFEFTRYFVHWSDVSN